MFRSMLFRGFACGAVATLTFAGCGREAAPLPGAGQEPAESGAPANGAPATESSAPETMPPGHPPVSSPGEPATSAEAGQRPLKAQGIGSQVELDHCLAKLEDPAARARFEEGFRACFTTEQPARDYILAAAASNEVLAKVPNFAPAYRVLAYAKLNTGFDMVGATEMYQKAVEADPEYGEAHYGLAFMLSQTDREKGRVHFEKAMSLGIVDERDLRTQFYPAGT